VILYLPDATYERLAEKAAAVHKPLEQWIIDVLRGYPETTLGKTIYLLDS
jgi:hypothetical protein